MAAQPVSINEKAPATSEFLVNAKGYAHPFRIFARNPQAAIALLAEHEECSIDYLVPLTATPHRLECLPEEVA